MESGGCLQLLNAARLGLASHHQLLLIAFFVHLTLLLTDVLMSGEAGLSWRPEKD